MPSFIPVCNKLFLEFKKTGILDPDRTGGYLTVLSVKWPEPPLLIGQIGQIDDQHRAAIFRLFSQEKASRLWPETNHTGGHFSSWQSRLPEIDCWGGAIIADDYILSFSGLNEQADQALMLVLAIQCELLTYEEACKIANISHDEKYFRHLAFNLKMN